MAAVDPVSTTDNDQTDPPTHIAAYAADIASLEALELSAERDEGNWFSKIKAVELAEDDGADVTAITYQETEDMDLSELAFEKYATDVDVQSIKAIHQTKGDTFLFKGEAYIQTQPTKILVFREKPAE